MSPSLNTLVFQAPPNTQGRVPTPAQRSAAPQTGGQYRPSHFTVNKLAASQREPNAESKVPWRRLEYWRGERGLDLI